MALLAQDIGRRAGPIADPGNLATLLGGSAFGGTAAVVLGGAALSSGIVTSGLEASPLLPAVPGAVEKLQRIGLSVSKASQIATSLTSQRLIDKANGNNINVIKQLGDQLIRITLDPTGQRIISAGRIQERNIINSIAAGRFIQE